MKAKDGIKVCYILERKVAEALDEFCLETGRTKTRVIELAVIEYIKRHKEK